MNIQNSFFKVKKALIQILLNINNISYKIGLIFFSGLTSILGYFVQIVMAKLLTKNELSMALSALAIGPSLWALTFTALLPGVVSYIIFDNILDTEEMIKKLNFWYKCTLIVTCFFAITGILLSETLFKALNYNRSYILQIVFVFLFFSTINSFFNAILQSYSFFYVIALKDFLYTLIKLSLTWIFISYLNLGFLSVIYSELITSVVCFLVIKKYTNVHCCQINIFYKSSLKLQSMFIYLKKGIFYGMCSVLISFLSSVDLLLVRLDGNINFAGNFSRNAVIGKATFFLTSILGNILFVETITKKKEERYNISNFVLTLLVTFLFGVLFSILILVFSNHISLIMYGDTNLIDTKMLFWISIYMMILSLFGITLNYANALEQYTIILYCVILYIFYFFTAFIIQYFHIYKINILQFMLIGNIMLFLSCFLMILLPKKVKL